MSRELRRRSVGAAAPEGSGTTSGGQLGATVAAPALDDGPARAGRHAGAEAVLLGAAAVVGLERALHGGCPPWRCHGGTRHGTSHTRGSGDLAEGTATGAGACELVRRARVYGAPRRRGNTGMAGRTAPTGPQGIPGREDRCAQAVTRPPPAQARTARRPALWITPCGARGRGVTSASVRGRGGAAGREGAPDHESAHPPTSDGPSPCTADPGGGNHRSISSTAVDEIVDNRSPGPCWVCRNETAPRGRSHPHADGTTRRSVDDRSGPVAWAVGVATGRGRAAPRRWSRGPHHDRPVDR